MRSVLKTTLKLRLCLIITGLTAAVTITGGIYIVYKASDDTGAEVASAVNLADHFINAEAAVLRDRWQTNGFSPPAFHLQELADVRHINVIFRDERGRTLDSNIDRKNPNPLAPAWFAALVRDTSSPMESQVRPIDFAGKIVGRVVISPDPSYEVDEIWTTSKNLLGLITLLFVLLNVIVWLAVSRTMRPVEQIIEALGEISRDNLATRLPSFGSPEMSRISVGFNQMATTLEHSVAENRRLTLQMLRVQEEERLMLARDLHDEIGQCMSAIHADAIVILNHGGTEVRDSAEAIVMIVSQIKKIIRSMLQRLRTPVMEGLGLEKALRELAASFTQRNPQITCTLEISPALANLGGERAAAIYRVIQECLTNVAAHSSAQRVSIDMAEASDSADTAPQIRLTIKDDGVGFSTTSSNPGYGLLGIQERIQDLGGQYKIDSNPGNGTRICVEVPLTEAALESAA